VRPRRGWPAARAALELLAAIALGVLIAELIVRLA
jgi:hypothetical protein